MAISYSLPSLATSSLTLLLLISLSPTALSQDPVTRGPTISDCATRLLPLAPCTPFVQGSGQSSPTQMCCENLHTLYNQQPGCLCLLLNDTTLSSFPINTTLSLQLPSLCNLAANISDCSGVAEPVAPSSAGSQISLGTNTNSSAADSNSSTNAASPMVPVSPRPSIMGFGFGRSAGVKLKTEASLAIAGALAAILLSNKVVY